MQIAMKNNFLSLYVTNMSTQRISTLQRYKTLAKSLRHAVLIVINIILMVFKSKALCNLECIILYEFCLHVNANYHGANLPNLWLDYGYSLHT